MSHAVHNKSMECEWPLMGVRRCIYDNPADSHMISAKLGAVQWTAHEPSLVA
jgi:hypothetical protein